MRRSSKSTSQGASACAAWLLRRLAALSASSPELERAEAGGEGVPRADVGGEPLPPLPPSLADAGGEGVPLLGGSAPRAVPGGVGARVPSAGCAALPCCSWLVT